MPPMPLPRELLNDYESIAVDLHPHWWYFVPTATGLGAAIVLSIFVQLGLDGDVERFLSLVLLVLIVVLAFSVLWKYLTWRTTNFVVTSHRLIYRSGVLAKSSVEIPLERVNNVNFRQSIFERMIGAGDLLIESAGSDGRQRFSDIRNPSKVQNAIHAQIEAKSEMRAGQGSGRSSEAEPDVTEQIARLHDLLGRGAITQAEYDDQKRRLLG
jgi:uncharacterized membrane protein YdbT with pleckstrin-like domain